MILKRQEKNNKIKALYDSSNILASTYDTDTCDLMIIFKSGTHYKYPNVSKSDYMRFEVADSQGKVFNTHIKKYAFEKMDNFDVSEIIAEADKLMNAEKNALVEAKRLEIINKITYLNHLSQQVRNEDNDKIFNENLIKFQSDITNYLNEIELSNGKTV